MKNQILLPNKTRNSRNLGQADRKVNKVKKGKKNKKAKFIEVYGPVENLESYVRSEWWKEIFNANYLRTDGDVVDDSEITQGEIEAFIAILGVEKNNSILDICCGQGRHCFELSRRGYKNITGLDRSHYLISKARKQSRMQGNEIIFREGDARKLPFRTDSFDFVTILGNSFGYFETLNDDRKILSEIFRVLKPQGKVLFDLADGDFLRKNYQARSWEWIDKNYFVCRERELSKDKNRLISREVITHTKNGVTADQFYAERLYTFEIIKNLLEEYNFSEIKSHKSLTTLSKRNQDLGMMEKRIIVSTLVDKLPTIPKKISQKKTHVIVLLGDPNLNDEIKPDGIFDDDDHFTISKLKKALGKLKDYEFSFLDKHKSFISKLYFKKNKIDFVFNLCDEGFWNDAKKELHIPALLEILDIPYTGGNPQCLSFCYDKSLVRGIARELDIPVPEAFIIKPESINFIDFTLNFPVIVKPNLGDSSIGITAKSVCYDIAQLEEAITQLRSQISSEMEILVEEFLIGKDITVGIIGNISDEYTMLPIIQEDYSALPPDLPKICGYEAKWLTNSPYAKLKSIPANLNEETEQFLNASCLKLFSRLQCRDYARFDWRLDNNNTPRLLEANPNPGWCWDGHLAKMAELASISYQELLEKILTTFQKRITTFNK